MVVGGGGGGGVHEAFKKYVSSHYVSRIDAKIAAFSNGNKHRSFLFTPSPPIHSMQKGLTVKSQQQLCHALLVSVSHPLHGHAAKAALRLCPLRENCCNDDNIRTHMHTDPVTLSQHWCSKTRCRTCRTCMESMGACC